MHDNSSLAWWSDGRLVPREFEKQYSLQGKVFPTNVGNMFVNPMRDRLGSDGDVNNPLKDISQKVATMWSNIRTRTLSGNLVEGPPGNFNILLNGVRVSVLQY